MTFLQNQDSKYFVCFKMKAYTLKNPYEPTSHHFQVDSLFKWQTEVCSWKKGKKMKLINIYQFLDSNTKYPLLSNKEPYGNQSIYLMVKFPFTS